jgi:hypothetical protein
MTVGNLLIEFGLAVLAVRGINTQQNHGERIRIFEIMQERGALMTTEQIMSLPPHVQEQLAIEIEERIEVAYRDAQRYNQQKALPAPKQAAKKRNVSYAPRGHVATVKSATNSYNPEDEAYDDEDGAVTIRRSNSPKRRMSREEEW